MIEHRLPPRRPKSGPAGILKYNSGRPAEGFSAAGSLQRRRQLPGFGRRHTGPPHRRRRASSPSRLAAARAPPPGRTARKKTAGPSCDYAGRQAAVSSAYRSADTSDFCRPNPSETPTGRPKVGRTFSPSPGREEDRCFSWQKSALSIKLPFIEGLFGRKSRIMLFCRNALRGPGLPGPLPRLRPFSDKKRRTRLRAEQGRVSFLVWREYPRRSNFPAPNHDVQIPRAIFDLMASSVVRSERRGFRLRARGPNFPPIARRFQGRDPTYYSPFLKIEAVWVSTPLSTIVGAS